MPSTVPYGLPYPNPTDRARDGATAVRLLAEAVNARMRPAVAQIEEDGNGSTIGAAPVPIVFPGPQTYMEGFSYAGGSLTYAGPTRLFLIAATVEVEHAFALDSLPAYVSSTAQLFVSDSQVSSSYDMVAVEGGAIGDRSVVHPLTVPVQLSAGDVIVVKIAASPDGKVGRCALRVYPIGPATA